MWTGWLGPAAVERIVQQFAESSMGDPLYGAHIALLLLPAGGAALQRAVWGALSSHAALHLLPPPAGCLGGGGPYLAGPFEFGFVAEAAKSLGQGDLVKALRLGSISADLALHAVADMALDQASWAREQAREDGAAAERRRRDARAGRPRGSGSAAAAVDAAGRATNVLRGVMRGAGLDTVRRLLAAGRARGQGTGAQRRALAVACHGDAELMEKLARLMAEEDAHGGG
jgi:hypothetical protein